ncbi:relaxase/mobilization nuclease domain-containing protein, partial [Enterococcus faecium]|uniref:relaxase/mobilization nuclease domain-containing protein n=1 Tax=Enterococcus faecium TaxID=1352 RepID=UPI003CC6248E
MARKVAPEFEVAVYSHTDKEHIHNHIVINAVSFETGKKYLSNKAQRELVKTKNEEIARAFGLSVPEK